MTFDLDIRDVLSDATSGRVYPSVLAQGTILPAITYQRVSTRRVRSHGGTSLVLPLYQVACWDATPVGARDVARDVIDAFESELGVWLVENQFEDFASEQKLYRVLIDVRLWAGVEEEVGAGS